MNLNSERSTYDLIASILDNAHCLHYADRERTERFRDEIIVLELEIASLMAIVRGDYDDEAEEQRQS